MVQAYLGVVGDGFGGHGCIPVVDLRKAGFSDCFTMGFHCSREIESIKIARVKFKKPESTRAEGKSAMFSSGEICTTFPLTTPEIWVTFAAN